MRRQSKGYIKLCVVIIAPTTNTDNKRKKLHTNNWEKKRTPDPQENHVQRKENE